MSRSPDTCHTTHLNPTLLVVRTQIYNKVDVYPLVGCVAVAVSFCVYKGTEHMLVSEAHVAQGPLHYDGDAMPCLEYKPNRSTSCSGKPGCKPRPFPTTNAAQAHGGGRRCVEEAHGAALYAQGRLASRTVRVERIQSVILGQKITGPGRPHPVHEGRDWQGGGIEMWP